MEYSLASYSPAKTTTTLTPTILERSNPPWFSNLWIVSRNQRENRKLDAKAKKTTELRQWRTIMVSPPVVMLITTIQKQSNLLWIEKEYVGATPPDSSGEDFPHRKKQWHIARYSIKSLLATKFTAVLSAVPSPSMDQIKRTHLCILHF